jgi:hypothetical protein
VRYWCGCRSQLPIASPGGLPELGYNLPMGDRPRIIYLKRFTPGRIVGFAGMVVLWTAIATTRLTLPWAVTITIGTALLVTWLASVIIRKFWKLR